MESALHRALLNLLNECFDGPAGQEAYMLNPGDAGLLRQLESIDARQASTPPGPGRATVAAHADHALYGLDLLNRWAAGEPNPWATADWSASWKRGTVDDAAWRALRDRLRAASVAWRSHLKTRESFDALAANGSLASLAHTMYHLGAIRQIVLSVARE